MNALADIAADSKAWPFQEARKVLERVGGMAEKKSPQLVVVADFDVWCGESSCVFVVSRW